MRTLAPLLLLLAAGCPASDHVDGVADPSERETVDVGDAPSRGPADAVVTLVEFGDFECPYCGAAEPTLARLLADYPTELRLVFKQFPLSFHEYAQLAAEASLAANAQGAFWAFHDALYAHQDQLARTDLEGYATALSLDLAGFDAALDQHTYAAAVSADVDQGAALGVPGTPTFYVNGREAVGNLPYDTLAAAIDQEIDLATP